MKRFMAFAALFLSMHICISVYVSSIEGSLRAQLEESFKTKSAEEIFTAIYETNYWHGWESRSGQGSNISTTIGVRSALREIVHHYRIKTLLDAPCGDFNWMKEVVTYLDLELYLGVDIVKSVIKACQQQYGSPCVLFMHADLITTPLPKMDMIFSRDCLAHMSYADALHTLKNFKASGSTYFLTSHHVATTANISIITGGHYPINLMLPPFNFPAPLLIVREQGVEPVSAHQSKALALWCFEDLVL